MRQLDDDREPCLLLLMLWCMILFSILKISRKSQFQQFLYRAAIGGAYIAGPVFGN